MTTFTAALPGGWESMDGGGGGRDAKPKDHVFHFWAAA